MIDRNSIDKMRNFSEYYANNFVWNFLNSYREIVKNEDFIQLWRQWPGLLKIRV